MINTNSNLISQEENEEQEERDTKKIIEIERDQIVSSPSLMTKTIPIVDLSHFDEELIARAVVKASQEWGAFQVVNHEIPTELIRRLQMVGTQFFELPENEKEAVAKPPNSKDIQGYETKSQKDPEDGVDRVDYLFHNISPPSWIDYRYWPKNPPEYRYIYPKFFFSFSKLGSY